MPLNKKYHGIGILGCENIASLYGVNNGIVDWKGVGLQHLFYKNFERDLIHSATSYIKWIDANTVEIANRLIDGKSHPNHQEPIEYNVINGYKYKTKFQSQVDKSVNYYETIEATWDDSIIFSVEIENNSDSKINLEVGGYIILRNPLGNSIEINNNQIIWNSEHEKIQLMGDNFSEFRIIKDSYTGFMHSTMDQLLYDKISPKMIKCKENVYLGATLGKKIIIQPNSAKKIYWSININNETINLDYKNICKRNKEKWNEWLEDSIIDELDLQGLEKEHFVNNLVALKAATINGFVPADMTGHYFTEGSPSYYARDSMMIAKAFINAKKYKEAKDIIMFLYNAPTKNNNGEFFQRYNVSCQPSLGANNDVLHQLDSQGYFTYNVAKIYDETGELIIPYDDFLKYILVVKNTLSDKYLMAGPEGGVNEGVFGRAYITSTNMFIAGGFITALKIIKHFGTDEDLLEVERIIDAIKEGIEKTFIPETQRLGYGFVDYFNEPIAKYDTPVFFAPLYGFPLTESFLKTNYFMLKHSRFFGKGVGYSEQEYHHGPWIFNTCACAQTQYILGNFDEYQSIVNWLIEHSNEYYLMPEAIDANNEELCWINPLIWACAEMVSTLTFKRRT